MDAKVQHSLNLIEEAMDKHSKIAVACSFGKDSIVTLELARRLQPNISVFSLMTPFKPKETFHFMRKLKKKWHLNLTVYHAEIELTDELRNLHKIDPDKCCEIFKVTPCKRAVKDLDAWICGLRNTEGRTRINYQEVEFRGLAKINPILQWTEADVWRYTAVHNLPVHPFYGLGYRSLGCDCCSKPNTTEERGGRWEGTSKCGLECGIHSQKLK